LIDVTRGSVSSHWAADALGVDRAADQKLDGRIIAGPARHEETLIGEIADARREAKPQQIYRATAERNARSI
jgi:hypothetical protein